MDFLNAYLLRLKEAFFDIKSTDSWPWLLCFVAVSFIYYTLNSKKISLKEAFTYIFPKSVYLSRSAKEDVVIYLINIAITSSFFLAILDIDFRQSTISKETFSILARFLSDDVATEPTEDLVWVNWLFTLGVFIAWEIGLFSFHFASHKIPYLWAFHKVHHNATSLNPLTARRAHFVDHTLFRGTAAALAGIVLFLFHISGHTPSPVFIFGVFPALDGIGLLFYHARHSHVPISYGTWDRYFISPVMHHVHHSCKPEHIDKNFGRYTTILDRAFGTLYIPKKGETLVLGLTEDDPGAYKAGGGVIKMNFIDPFIEAFNSFRAKPTEFKKVPSDEHPIKKAG